MSALAPYFVGAIGVFKRDAVIFFSYRGPVVAQILATLFSLALFFFISKLVQVGRFASPDAYFAYVVVGLVILQVLRSTLGLCTALRGELLTGTFERMVVSAFGPVNGITAMLLFPILQASVYSSLTLGLGAVVFGMPIQWATAALAIPVAILASVSFAAIGLLFAAMVLVVKQASSGTSFVIAGMSIVAGLYFPTTLLPGWIEWTSEIQPFTPAVELLRNVLVDIPLRDPAWLSLVKLAVSGAILFPLAVWALRSSVRLAQRRGTIIEY